MILTTLIPIWGNVMAIYLSKVIGSTPEICLGMQMAYDLWQTRDHVDRINIDSLRLSDSQVELSEMFRIWCEETFANLPLNTCASSDRTGVMWRSSFISPVPCGVADAVLGHAY